MKLAVFSGIFSVMQRLMLQKSQHFQSVIISFSPISFLMLVDFKIVVHKYL